MVRAGSLSIRKSFPHFIFFQELDQADISTIKKNESKKRLEVIRKAHDKQNKDREIELKTKRSYILLVEPFFEN